MEDLNQKHRKKQNLVKYSKLTGLAFQIGITIYIFAFIGKKLDERFQNEKKILTMVFVLAGMILSIYSLIIQLKKLEEKK